MQDLFSVYNFINIEILRMQEYLLKYQDSMPDLIGKYYDNMPEHEEIEDYLNNMNYACYSKLVSDKLINFVRKKTENGEEIKKELEFLKITRESIGNLIYKLAKVKKKDLNVVLGKINGVFKISTKEDYINLYLFQEGILFLNPIFNNIWSEELEEFFHYYINQKYKNSLWQIVDAYDSYIAFKNNGEAYLTK